MGIPNGVTVGKIGTPMTVTERPRNLLEKAALCDDREQAIAIICGALALNPNSPCRKANLTWPERWAKFSTAGRLKEIGDWVRAECFECMDLVEGPAISTRGD